MIGFKDIKTFFENRFLTNKLNLATKLILDDFIIYGPYSMIRNYLGKNSIVSIIQEKTKNILNDYYDLSQFSENNNIIILDIGANIGIYSLAYTKLPFSRVFAFEPFPSTYKFLNDNKNMNRIHNLNIYPFGLMDKKQTLSMGSPQVNATNNYFKKILNKSDEFESGCKTIFHDPGDMNNINCSFEKGDSFFKKNKFNHLHYVKIDTEGSEYHVLQGMKETLALMKPIIQLEINTKLMNNVGLDINELKDLLINLGYKKYRLFGETQLNEKSINQLSTSSLYGSKDYVFFG